MFLFLLYLSLLINLYIMKKCLKVKTKLKEGETRYQRINKGKKLYTEMDMRRIYRQGTSDGMGVNHPKDIRFCKDLCDLIEERIKAIATW